MNSDRIDKQCATAATTAAHCGAEPQSAVSLLTPYALVGSNKIIILYVFLGVKVLWGGLLALCQLDSWRGGVGLPLLGLLACPLNVLHIQSAISIQKTAGQRRPRGKPCTRWMDIVTRDQQHLGLSMAKAVPIAQDRTNGGGLVNLNGKTPPLTLSRRPDDDDDDDMFLFFLHIL